MSIYLFCGSKKPAPGIESVSAAREMLREIDKGVKLTGTETMFRDLRDFELPFWDGRNTNEYDSADLEILYEEMKSATGFIFSIPAYWNAISGGMKNVFDLLGAEPFVGKLVGLLIVGMDEESAYSGAFQSREIISSLGGWVPPQSIIVGNPRDIPDRAQLIRELRNYGSYIGLLVNGKIEPFKSIGTREKVANE